MQRPASRFEVLSCRWLLLPLIVLSNPVAFSAQDSDDDELRPGLVAAYRTARREIERVDPDIAFAWGDAAPDVRLQPGAFEVTWHGQLLIRHPGRYRLHAYLQGTLRVVLDGTTVLEASAGKPGWYSGKALGLAFGEKPLTVEFRRSGPAARVMLCWSSDAFPLEPIPSHLLFRPRPREDLDRLDRGRRQFASLRCNRCHRRADDVPASPSPDLGQLRAGTSREWATRHILDPSRDSAHARMPKFGFQQAEAEAIVAWLGAKSRIVELERVVEVKPKEREKALAAGNRLIRSLGCLACHRLGKEGTAGPFGGGDLAGVGHRRSPAWLATWLAKPESLNRDHRMPLFKLSPVERTQLVLALSVLGGPFEDPDRPSRTGQLKLGEQLVRDARCAACHRLPADLGPISGITDLSRTPTDWSQSCLDEAPDRKRLRPAYGRGIDRAAIRAWIESRAEAGLSRRSAFDRGRLVLEQRNCLACHERDGGRGIVEVAGAATRAHPELKGQSQALIPPALTAVGDKLVDDALRKAVAGEAERVRLPWLAVRMPRFVHAKPDRDALVEYLVGHDRIPAGAPDQPAVPAAPAGRVREQHLVTGQALVGAGGFSCIACHAIGSYQPKNVALGTRGSDLHRLGRTMRREFYIRWTRSPLRIVPGMEMPSYSKAVPRMLDGDVERQLAATWDALNDPRFIAPTNPTAVEQFLVVAPDAQARIVRDVFALPKSQGGGAVARGIAIGLPNGHNMLFDLDTGGLRMWTIGDFARQRTQGKSWYWDMAGLPLLTGFDNRSDLVFVSVDKQGPKKVFHPVKDGPTACRLLYYRRTGHDVQVGYRLVFQTGKTRQVLKLIESFEPVPVGKSGKGGGWDRGIHVEHKEPRPRQRPGEVRFGATWPRGWEVYVARPVASAAIGSPSVTTRHYKAGSGKAAGTDIWRTLPGQGQREFARLDVDSAGLAFGPVFRRTVLRYRCGLVRERTPLKPAKPVTFSPQPVTSVPGFSGVRLPLPRSIMPTAICWRPDGSLAFTSLKGHVYVARDTDGDGLEDSLTVFEEGLAAPYGIIADGDDLIVCHKPEVLRLRDSDGDGRADVRHVLATGWGYSDNYHDWTCGIVRDAAGNLYVGLGSDYAQKGRKKETTRWRGKVLKITPDGPRFRVTPVGHAFRYPTGLAIDAKGRIFVSDNQGMQNTFNEINHLVPGRHYGVPSLHGDKPDAILTPPAIQVPHPWTRSVNGLFFLPASVAGGALAGDGIGCEYDNRLLVRFTVQEVNGELQGAVYHFSRPNAGVGGKNFVGPLCGGVSPNGDITIASIHDSGWLGGRNTGSIVRLSPDRDRPNGIRRLTAAAGGFRIEFFKPVDPRAAGDAKNYSISAYTRTWTAGYSTPDSGRHRAPIESVAVAPDARSVTLAVKKLKPGYVYEVTCLAAGGTGTSKLFPATGHYFMREVPAR